MAKHSGHNDGMRNHSDETLDVHGISNPDVQHEKNDVNVFAIVNFVGALTLATLAVFGLMFGMLRALEAIEKSRETEISPLARKDEERLPPHPRLQGATGHKFTREEVTNDPELRKKLTDQELDFQLETPTMEWDVLRNVKLRELRTYGTDERKPGEYRIPVDRAKELLIERSLLASRQPTGGQTGTAQVNGGQQRTAVAPNEVEQMIQTEGYDPQPTYQSAGQKAERRRQ